MAGKSAVEVSSEQDQGNITYLLGQISDGNPGVAEQLVPLVYEELRRLAHQRLRSERNNHTLQTTALVHEVYLKLIDSLPGDLKGRTHFFAIASKVMRQILIDSARVRLAKRRGGDHVRVTLDENLVCSDQGLYKVLLVDEALTKLEKQDRRQASVVEMRFFVGLEFEEIAEALGVSVRTVLRDWRSAQAWIYSELNKI